MLRYINIKSNNRNEFVDVTALLCNELSEMDLKDGIVCIFVPHTSAAITINEGADPSVRHDIISTLSRLIPKDSGYHHMEGNSDAHLKSSIVGASICVPVEEGKLVLGTWQAIYFCEFDGPRHRRVGIKALKA
jgi:secondary thiamine-phosphate synthase enzyme